jgi:hypothetical protein
MVALLALQKTAESGAELLRFRSRQERFLARPMLLAALWGSGVASSGV